MGIAGTASRRLQSAERLAELNPLLSWAPNTWMGGSLENKDCAFRIDHLRQIGLGVKFVSIEPLLGAVPDMDLQGIDWVTAGGKSRPGARFMYPEWVLDVCRACAVPFFFKQWGGTNRRKTGRLLNGRTWDEMPDTACPDANNLFGFN